MKADTARRLGEIESKIRAADGTQAQEAIKALFKEGVARPYVLKLAELARRASLPDLSVRLLQPLVRPSNKAPATATAPEQAEYAASLSRIGATDEALLLLTGLRESGIAQVALFTAYAHFSRWSYPESVPFLREYVRHPELDDYTRLVGKINLCAALIYTREHAEAHGILDALFGEVTRENHQFLRANVLELRAQNAILSGEWANARECLADAGAVLKHSAGREEFYVRRWAAVLALLESEGTPSSRALLHRIREEAHGRQLWEIVRDCDRFEALATGNRALIQRVYFGTPYAGFRDWVRKYVPGGDKLPESYAWHLGPRGKAACEIDLPTGTMRGGNSLRPQQRLHRLLQTLASDTYRPFRVATLLAGICPGEYFSHVSSPAKIHQSIKRLRRWLAQEGIPLVVKEGGGLYVLEASEPVVIWKSNEARTGGTGHPMIAELRRRFSGRPFTISEAKKVLEIPRRSLSRLLQTEIADGNLGREGKGIATRYSFPRKK